MTQGLSLSHGVREGTVEQLRPGLSAQPFNPPFPVSSGGTARIKPHRCHRRYLEEQEIRQALHEGRLCFRCVSKVREAGELSRVKKIPKPVSMALFDIPRKLPALPFEDYIGIVNPEPLFCYKDDVCSDDLMDGIDDPNMLSNKNLTDCSALKDKLEEMSQRLNWPIYSDGTSGHLNADTTFTLPKFKPSCPSSLVQHYQNELIMQGYHRGQIKCFVVSNRGGEHLYEILQRKKSLESTLKLPELPLVIVSEESGEIVVWFEHELPDQKKQLELHECENRLEKILSHLGIEKANYHSLMAYLSLDSRLRALDTITGEQAIPEVPYINEIMSLVSAPPSFESVRMLKTYKEKGAYFNLQIAKKYSCESLADILLKQEIIRDHDAWCSLDSPSKMAVVNRQTEAGTKILELLIRKGARIVEKYAISILAPVMTSYCDILAAFDKLENAYPSFSLSSGFHCQILARLPMDLAGRTVSLQRFMERCGSLQVVLELYMESCIHSERSFLDEPENKEVVLLFLRYGVNPEPFLEKLVLRLNKLRSNEPEEYQNALNQQEPELVVKRLMGFWTNKESEPLYQQWPVKLDEAVRSLESLKLSLGIGAGEDSCSLHTISDSALKFVGEAFNQPLQLIEAGDNDATILQVLKHYYRRPGPERAKRALQTSRLEDIWKPSNNCNHALRVRNNVHWFIEYLQLYASEYFSPAETELLALAGIYHDAAADDVSKDQEERQAASFFMRDLSNHYPQEIVQKIADALSRKEDDRQNVDETSLDSRTRLYLRVLRFADRLDFIRCSGIPEEFPEPAGITGVSNPHDFDARLLDLPTGIQTSKPALKAAMHGAVDLAEVSGVGSSEDRRQKSSYSQRHQLHPRSSILERSFERCLRPVTRMNGFIDDNVRRMIARRAGLVTCSDNAHQHCRPDTRSGHTFGIHNDWHDLKQVEIPENMTLLEKMQCEDNYQSLSEKTRKAIEIEVGRIRSQGIKMSLGSLTQDTLGSKAAQARLRERGFEVISEQRQRNYYSGRTEWVLSRKLRETPLPPEPMDIDPQDDNPKLIS